MKGIFKIMFSFLLLTESFASLAQPDLTVAVDKYIDSLSDRIDTSITLTDNSYHTPYFSNYAKGTGEISIFGTSTIIYFTKAKWFAIKFIDALDSVNSRRLFISQIIDLPGNDALQLLRKLTPKVEREYFLPYVYQYEEKGITVYNIFASNHPHLHHVTIRSKDYYLDKLVEDDTLKEKIEYISDSPTNLNFAYNKSLSLYTFYQTLTKIEKRMDFQFSPK